MAKSSDLTIYRMKTAILYSLLLLLCFNAAADPQWEGAFDTINISADEAVEDEVTGVLHLSGNFTMQSERWRLTSLRAAVYGKTTKPDRILLEGNPAHFTILPGQQDNGDIISATAQEVEYLRGENVLELRGGASLAHGEETIHSESIRYDIATGRFLAGGDERVLISVTPKD
jgi:lipopolysaccharide transport protein LptA